MTRDAARIFADLEAEAAVPAPASPTALAPPLSSSPAAAPEYPDAEIIYEEADAPTPRVTGTPIQLTEEQERVVSRLLAGVKEGRRQQTLGGYAGTGKTTVIKYLLRELKNWATCAFTGKAANVLRRKGVPASTIHSLIYAPYDDPETGLTKFRRRYELVGVNGIIVDEASMVGEQIYDDLRAFDLPIIFVGDHGQLEPVGSKFNLMLRPQHTLEHIHRNAGQIVKFAEALRLGDTARIIAMQSSAEVTFLTPQALTAELLSGVDQVCCAFNKTRVRVNASVRAARGHEGVLVEGERIICLRNDRQLGVYNGMQGVVRGVHPHDQMTFEADGIVYRGVRYDAEQFGREKAPVFEKNSPLPFDYAYCCTAHKLQGDEADTVLVLVEESPLWSFARWAYTAATRARHKLIWVQG